MKTFCRIAVLLFLSGVAHASFVPGPIQVNNGAGTATSVGYAASNSSVPVNVLNTVTVAGTVTANGTIAINNFPATYTVTPGTGTFPVSGTFWQTTQPISIAGSVPIISTNTLNVAATQTTSPWVTNQFPSYTVTPGTGTWPISGTVTSTPGPISVLGVSGSTVTVGYQTGNSSVPVNVLNTVAVSGTIGVNNFPATYTVTPGSGTWPISGTVSSTPGPIQIWGVSESTKTIGYSANSSSMPVNVLNTVAVTGTFWQATQPISGTVAVNNFPASYTVTPGTGTFPVSIAANLNVSSSSVKLTDGVDIASVTTAGAVLIDGSATTQPISGTITANQGTSPWVTNQFASYTVTPGTGTWPISGSVTSTPGPISILGVSGSTITVGYQTGDSSVPVNVLNTVPVTGTFWQATQPISGTVSATQGTSPWVTNQFQSYTVTPGTGTFTIAGTVQPGNTQNTTAWIVQTSTVGVNASTIAVVNAGSAALKVDGSAVTQPVSGTVSITANSSVNVAQVAGTTTDTNSGSKSAGTQRIVIATDQPALTNALKVDGSAVTQPVSGTVTANAGTGNFSVTGSTVTILTSGGGNLPVSVNNTPNIGTVTTITNAVSVNPSTMTAQGIAQTTALPTAVAAGAQVPAFYDKFGRAMVSGIPRDQIKQATATLTNTTETVFISSGAASVFNDICGCVVSNTSTSATRIDLRGQGNGGTINQAFEIPAQDTRGFWPGCQNPFVQLSSASNWTIQLSGSVTDVRITCQYIPLK